MATSGAIESASSFTSATLSKGVPKLSRKNQVTIPVEVLREAGFSAEDDVVVRAAGRGRIEIDRYEDLISELSGSLPPGTYPAGYLDQLRDEWER
jgi:bifunctional DNA-binding transcriptional regulator/antitoxin component of YhaV-PrlF toxin-antitoxin module